jgi:hypothetical protein
MTPGTSRSAREIAKVYVFCGRNGENGSTGEVCNARSNARVRELTMASEFLLEFY